MANPSSASAGHEKYYVPESSSLAVRATIGLILSVFGAAMVLNDMTFGGADESSTSVWVLTVGLVFFIFTLASWFGTAIRENLAGMNSSRLHQSYVLGMFWFIFSEVMFFAAFFGALFYVRQLAGPWLAGEGEGGRMNGLLWPGFEFAWPPVTTPQEAVGGVDAQVIQTMVFSVPLNAVWPLPMRTTGISGFPCGTPWCCYLPRSRYMSLIRRY